MPMIRPAAVIFVLFAAGLAAGCAGREPPAPLSSAACAGADWFDRGRDAALAGVGSGPGLAEIAACPAFADPEAREGAEDAFLAGHDIGRAIYCAPTSARELGRRQAPVTLACPPAMEADFAEAYAAGAAEAGGRRADRHGPRIRPSIGIGVGTGGTRVGGGVGVVF